MRKLSGTDRIIYNNAIKMLGTCGVLSLLTGCLVAPDAESEPIASAQQPLVTTVHLQAILAARDDGSGAPTITTTQLTNALPYLNQIWAGAGIQFAFDPNRDVMRLNSTAVGHGCTLPAGVTVPSNTKPGAYCSSGVAGDTTNTNNVFRNTLANYFPGKLVVYFSANEYIDETKAPPYDWIPNGTWSNGVDAFVMMNGDGGNAEVLGTTLAHEIGHYFHLQHTFADTPATTTELATLIREKGFCPSFDGDGLADTAPDPGPNLFASNNLNACNPDTSQGTLALDVTVVLPTITCSYVLTPDRFNVMNYWNKTSTCLNTTATFTQQQLAIVNEALTSGNRNHLLTYSATPPPVSYSISNANSGKLLGFAGAQIVQRSANDGDNALRWQLVDALGYLEIRNVSSQQVLAVTDMATWAGATIVQWNWNATLDQQWTLADLGTGFAKIVNRNSQKVAAVENMSTADGARILQWNDVGSADQRWLLSPKGRARVRNVNSGKVLAVTGMSTSNMAKIVQYTDNYSTDQQWFFDPATNGYFRIRDMNSGKVLAVTGQSNSNGAEIVQYDDNGTNDHLWRLRFVTGRRFLIQNYNGKVLAVKDMSLANMAQIVQWDNNGSADHVWELQ